MWVALLIKAVPSSYDESKADCASSERVGIDMWVGTYRPSVRRPTQCGRHTGLRSSRAGGGVCILRGECSLLPHSVHQQLLVNR